jgi:hypothetical protein
VEVVVTEPPDTHALSDVAETARAHFDVYDDAYDRMLDEIDRLRAENERLRAVAEAAKEYVRQALPAPHDLRLRVALARLDQRPAWKPPPANPDLMAEELHP